ncbi:MAG: hypothetical protein ACAH20_18155 [Methylobacteriaceae bacterium]|uniref:hypothetical protein n=1 Tax=Methylorubrum sp. POS3 TaxID=2998492 RepID=UPI00359999A9
MDKIAIEAARLLFADGGAGWIVAVLLGIACLHLYRDSLRSLEARIEETGATAAALERASQTNIAVAAALESRTRTLEDLTRLSAEIARDVERSDLRTRDKLEEILRRLDDLPHRPRS